MTDFKIFNLTVVNKQVTKMLKFRCHPLLVRTMCLSLACLSLVVFFSTLRPLWNPLHTKPLRKETWIAGVSWTRFISRRDNVARLTLNHVKIFWEKQLIDSIEPCPSRPPGLNQRYLECEEERGSYGNKKQLKRPLWASERTYLQLARLSCRAGERLPCK